MSASWTPSNSTNYHDDPDWGPHHHGWIAPFIALGFVVVLFGGIFLWSSFVGPGPMGGYAPRAWFFFPFGFLILLFVLFMGVRVLFWSARWGGRRGERYGATEILRARYARGEITREQFLQMQRDLADSH
ncbi:MAG: SHOCT domain-containing protein [Thermoplasmata archaeon]|nr:SHOCT domain-containing protein [Thermoplasmata archaeon]